MTCIYHSTIYSAYKKQDKEHICEMRHEDLKIIEWKKMKIDKLSNMEILYTETNKSEEVTLTIEKLSEHFGELVHICPKMWKRVNDR